LMGFVGMPVC